LQYTHTPIGMLYWLSSVWRIFSQKLLLYHMFMSMSSIEYMKLISFEHALPTDMKPGCGKRTTPHGWPLRNLFCINAEQANRLPI
jgi:hypothetical protein